MTDTPPSRDLSWLTDVPGIERATGEAASDDSVHVTVCLEHGYWKRAEESHLRAVSGLFDAMASSHSSSLGTGGWISAITREPFLAERMDRWASDAMAILLERPPRNILEIGCGDGMLLSRLAPTASQYVGTDLSSASLTRLAESLAEQPYRDVVELITLPAHDLERVNGSFDLIILNSIVQYFPSSDYLARALTLALSKLAPGGRVFVGDVRHLGHGDDLALRAAVQNMSQAATGLQVLADAERRAAEDAELLIHPAFFIDWAADAEIPAPEIRLRESATDDLGYFRYDVVIGTQASDMGPSAPRVVWAEVVADLDDAVASVANEPAVWVDGVPHTAARATRTWREAMMSDPSGRPPIPPAEVSASSILPLRLVDLCEELGLERALVSPGSDLNREDSVNVLLAPAGVYRLGGGRQTLAGVAFVPRSSHTSAPLESALSATLARRWRSGAPEHLRMLRPAFRFQPPQPRHGHADKREPHQITEPAILSGPIQYVHPRQTLHGIVFEHGERHPDETAIVDRDRQMTHRDLRSAVDDLAGRLQETGVRPGHVVGLYTGRGCEMVVGMLGILKAGAAYLALDRDNPPARTQHMLRTAEAVCVVSTSRAAGELANLVQHLVLVDESLEAPLHTPGAANHLDDGAEGAYVIFTSGSTGAPKAVLVEHGQACNLVEGLDSVLGRPTAGGTRTWLAATNICFDISIAEIFWPLSRGVRLVIGDTSLFRGAARERDEDLAGLFERHEVTHFQSTPSLIRLLLDDPRGRKAVRNLGALILGGEVLSRPLAEELSGVGLLVNGYGPTEATVYTTMHVLRQGDAGPVPIGTPLPNVAVRIVDESLTTLAIGQTGEVIIGGAGVARGYLGPASQQGGFITADIDGSHGRWYRTGDLGRIDAHGQLYYLGRLDGQVKIRGYRIELGEVEDTIRQHPHVNSCAVVVRGAGDTLTHLDAAVVLHTDASADFSRRALRDWISERLPAYMIPTSVTAVPSLPMTASGKLDRRAVLDMLPVRPKVDDDTASTDPASLQRTLCRIWSDVLGVEDVPLRENFFDVGGNSLLLAQVHQRLSAVLTAPPELLVLFRHPTIAGLVGYLSRQHGQTQESPPPTALHAAPSRRNQTLAIDRRRLRG